MEIFLNPLHVVLRRPSWVHPDEVTRRNYGIKNIRTGGFYKNSILESMKKVPIGVIAGTIASLDISSGFYRKCTQDYDKPMGLYALNSFSELKTINHGHPAKLTVYSGGYHEIGLYETHSEFDGITPLTYLPGDYLYASSFGHLTNEVGLGVAGGIPIAVVEKAPTEDHPTMIIKLADFPYIGNSILTSDFLTVSDIIDDTNSTATDKPLSARIGKLLFDSLESNLFKSRVYKIDSSILAQGYIDLGFEPIDRGGVVVGVKSGAVQMNYWSAGYSFAEFGSADFAIGDKAGSTNKSLLYFRSDGGLGGYTSQDLPNGTDNPELLFSDGSILFVYYQE